MPQIVPVRRVVTGHDASGKAVVVSDSAISGVPVPSGTSVQTTIWTTGALPVDNDDPADGRDRKTGITLPGGSVIRVVDMLPGTTAPMHRTSSLDFGIVISGSIELILDDGSVTRLEPGEIIVQRGTNHSWRNPCTEVTARVAFVLLDAKPATVDGVPLREIHPSEGIKP